MKRREFTKQSKRNFDFPSFLCVTMSFWEEEVERMRERERERGRKQEKEISARQNNARNFGGWVQFNSTRQYRYYLKNVKKTRGSSLLLESQRIGKQRCERRRQREHTTAHVDSIRFAEHPKTFAAGRVLVLDIRISPI